MEAAAWSSFDEFAAHAYADLVRFAHAISLTEGEDLAQEAMVRMAAAWQRIDREGNPEAYARRIVVRLHLNRLRSSRREARALLRLRAGDRAQAAETVDALEDASAPEWLVSALALLSDRQRAAVVLVHSWGYPIEETAQLLGCRPNTVKTHLQRAMKQLRTKAHAAHNPARSRK